MELTLSDSYALTAFLITVDRLGLMSMRKYCEAHGMHDLTGINDPMLGDPEVTAPLIRELWSLVEEYKDGC